MQFNTQLITDLANHIATQASGGMETNSVNWYTHFMIYRGTMPTIADYLTLSNGSNSEMYANNGSEYLYQYTNTSYGADDWINIGPTLEYTMIPQDVYLTPNRAGVAGWFAFTNRYYTSDATNVIMGTVGLPGSGADLEVSDVNFETTDFKIKFVEPLQLPIVVV